METTVAAKLITEGDGSCNTTHHVLTVPSRCSQQELLVLFERQCGLGEGSIAAEELFVIDQNAKYLNKRVRGENPLRTHRAKKAENNYYTFSPSDEIVVFTKTVNISRPSKRRSSPSLRSLTALCSNLTPHKFSRIDDTVIPDDSRPTIISISKQEIKNKDSCTTGPELTNTNEGYLQFPSVVNGDLVRDAYSGKTHPTPTERFSSPWISSEAHAVDAVRLRPEGIFRQLAVSPGKGCSDYHYNIEIESVLLQQDLATGEGCTNSGDDDEDDEEDDDDVEEFKSLVDYISRQLGENMIAQSLHGGRNMNNQSAMKLNYADESESLCSADSSSRRSGVLKTEESFLEDVSGCDDDDDGDGDGGEEEEEYEDDAMRNRSIIFCAEESVSDAHPAPDSYCDTSVMLSALGMKVSVTLGADGRSVSAVNLDDDDSASKSNALFGDSYCFCEGGKNSDASSAPQYLSDLLRSVKDKCDELLGDYLSHSSSNNGDSDKEVVQQQQQPTTALHVEQETSSQHKLSQLKKSNIVVKEVFFDLDDLMNSY